MSKARVRAKRRDRRRAKMSGWRRAGKQMGSHVGHGTSAPHTVSVAPMLPKCSSCGGPAWWFGYRHKKTCKLNRRL